MTRAVAVSAAVVGGIAALAAGSLALTTTSAGAAWLLARVPGVSAEGVDGSFAEGLRLGRLTWTGADGASVVAEGIELGAPTLRPTPSPVTWARVDLDAVTVQRLAVRTAPAPAGPRPPPRLPEALVLPVELAVGSLRVGELSATGLPAPVRDLQARVHLADDGGDTHRVEDLSLRWQRLGATGRLQLQARAPMRLQAQLSLADPGSATAEAAPRPSPAPSLTDRAWTAEVRADGPLARLPWSADLAAPGTGASLQAEGLLAPGSRWPLPALDLRARQVDLAQLWPQAPATRIDGRARIRPDDAAAAPASASGQAGTSAAPAVPALVVEVEVTNAVPRAVDDGGLPVTSLSTRARLADPADPKGAVRLERLAVSLADATAPAGRIQGDADWRDGRLQARLALEALRLPALHGRLPPLTLGGRVDGEADAAGGTPTPSAAAASAPRPSAPAAGSPATVSTSPRVSTVSAVRMRLDLTGEGRVAAPAPAPVAAAAAARPGRTTRAGRPPAPSPAPAATARTVPVALRGLLAVTPSAATLDDAELRVAEARASGRVAARRATTGGSAVPTWADAAAAGWTLDATVGLDGLDPGPWLPGGPAAPWRTRASRLSGELRASVGWPAGASPVGRRLAAATGDARVAIAPSSWLGVPLSGDVALSRAAADAPATVGADLKAAGNRLRVDGRARWPQGDTLPAGASPMTDTDAQADRWTVDLDAPALAALQPWLTASTGGPAIGGRLRLDGRVDGRWPVLRSEGRLQAEDLRFGAGSIARASGRWTLGPASGERLAVAFEAERATDGVRRIDRAELRVDGTLARHRVEADVVAAAVPPAWLRVLSGQPAQAPAEERSRWTLAADGAWRADAPGALGSVPVVSGAPAAEAPRPAPESTPPAPSTASTSPTGWHPALATWFGGRATRWLVTGLRGEVTAAGRTAPTAAPPRWLTVATDALELGVPGRGAGDADAWQLRTAPGALEAAGAALRWQRLGWRDMPGDRPPLFDADASLDPLRVAPLLARLQPGFGWAGDLETVGRLVVRSQPSTHAELRLQRRGGDLAVEDAGGRVPLGLRSGQVVWTVADGRWRIDGDVAGQRLGTLGLSLESTVATGAIWPAAAAPLSGRLQARVADLGVWGAWVPAGWRLGGRVEAEATVGGTAGTPTLTGALQGESLAVRNPLLGVAVEDGRLAVSLQGDRARIDTARARAGDGTLEITGGLRLGDAPTAEFTLAADRFQLLGRVDRRIVASGTTRVLLSEQAAVVDGRMAIDEGLIDFSRSDAPTLSSDVVVIDPAAPRPDVAPEPAAPAAPRAGPALAVDLRVDLGQRLRVRGRGLDTGLRGDLRVTSPGGRLAIAGTVRAIDGTYAAYGQRLAISRGVIVFAGPPDDPRLDIAATRPDVDVQVGVTITGFASRPRVRLFSEPEMSETEKLSWLLLGRASEGLGRNDAALLQRAALALLAGEGGGARDPISSLLGLDTLSLGQVEDGDQRATVVSLGKQLNRLWYVGYERNLNATTGNFQLIYRLARRFTLRAQSGEDNSLDIIWTFRWQ